ncbi:MAG TPA: hypothetical protein VK776_26130 [Bryobacteraceae bacterium]|nr:hypothetical protein [Bryobacteraceae bacterium]
MIRALTVLVAAACGVTAQTDAGLDLWVRVREHIRATAAQLPNYSCQEIMERSIQSSGGQIEFRERLRLEVLFAETTELFAWPGSSEFTPEPLQNWIVAGAIGNGDFAIELVNLFVRSTATVKYAGIETRDRRALHRFNFQVPLLSSRYTLAVHGKTAITAYAGSFWVDQESLDTVRLESRAEAIPAELDCSVAHQFVTYGRVRLGIGDRLLPSSGELSIVTRDGHESRNTIAFNNCRQYGASSALSFTTTPDLAEPATTQHQPAVPADVVLVLRLEQPISVAESAAGDPIEARLDKAVKAGGVLLPKGTRVHGRIRRLEQHLNSPASILVGLQFFAAETPGGFITFSARLTGPRATPGTMQVFNNRFESVPGAVGLDIQDDGAKTGVGSFRVPGQKLPIGRDFRTVWKTQ